MRTRIPRLAIAAALSLLAVPAGSSAASPVPDHGSCADFGANVSVLAQTLGSDFGSTASHGRQLRSGRVPAGRRAARASCPLRPALTPGRGARRRPRSAHAPEPYPSDAAVSIVWAGPLGRVLAQNLPTCAGRTRNEPS